MTRHRRGPGSTWPVRVIGAVALACHVLDAAADPCETLHDPPSSIPFERLHPSFAERVRPAPAAALRIACDEMRVAEDADQRLQARIDVGQALVGASREVEGVAILTIAIDEAVDARPSAALAAAYLRRGNGYGALREIKKAAPDYAQAREMLRALGLQDSVLHAEALLGAAAVLHQSLDVDEAQRAVDEADALLKRLGQDRTRVAGDVLNQRTMIAYARQDFAATLGHAEAEVALFRSIGGPDDREQLDALATIGAIRSMTGDFAGAEAAQREGLRLVAARDDMSFDAHLGLLQNFSTFYLDRAQPDLALPLAEEALALAKRHYAPESAALFREHLTLGAAHVELQRYAEAREDYRQAAAIEAANESTIAVLSRLRYFFRTAQLNLKLGDLDEVRSRLKRADALMGDDAKLGYWRGWGARIACHVDAVGRDWKAADADCAKAIAFLSEALAVEHPLVFEALVGRCLAQTSGGLVGDACAQVDQRLGRRAPADPRVRVLAYEALAARAARNGDADKAFELRLRTLSAAEEIASPDPLWATQYAVAESLAGRGLRTLAIYFAKQAIESIEAMRLHLDADRQRLERGFLSDKLTVYRHLAEWLLADGRTPEAIAVLKLLKREEMYDYGERAGAGDAGLAVPYSVAEERIARRLRKVDAEAPHAESTTGDGAAEIQRLVRLRDAKRISADEATRLDSLLSVAQTHEDARVARYRAFMAGYDDASVTTRVPASPAMRGSGRRATLASDEADAYFFMTDTRLNLVFDSRARTERRVIDIAAAQLGRTIGEELAALSSRADAAAAGDASRRPSALYAALGATLDRLARAQGVRRINLWLDGVLRYVPFAALWDGRAYLVERYEFAYLFAEPSASLPSRPRARRLVAFGVTRATGGLPALPGVGDELCEIVDGPVTGLASGDGGCASAGVGSGSLKGAAFANDYFTESRLASAMDGRDSAASGRVSMLHLGTHFSLRPGNMQRSWLMLGDGARLPLAQFQRLDFADVRLVTLSACETAMAGAVGDDGREIEGLPAMVHRRGARAVVASLWRVDDRSTASLMRRFYAGLGRGDVPVAQALRRAQLAMLNDRRDRRTRPYYWAAFVPSTITR